MLTARVLRTMHQQESMQAIRNTNTNLQPDPEAILTPPNQHSSRVYMPRFCAATRRRHPLSLSYPRYIHPAIHVQSNVLQRWSKCLRFKRQASSSAKSTTSFREYYLLRSRIAHLQNIDPAAVQPHIEAFPGMVAWCQRYQCLAARSGILIRWEFLLQ
jgi:hypothetical protein